jgi:hypothetical protein
MSTIILTDNAAFQCAHSAPATTAQGITISAVASTVSIGGAHPILAGALIAGFTPAICLYLNPGTGVPQPCVAFTLPPPSEQRVKIGVLSVFTSADAGAIATVPSSGNAIPGLTVTEMQTKVQA